MYNNYGDVLAYPPLAIQHIISERKKKKKKKNANFIISRARVITSNILNRFERRDHVYQSQSHIRYDELIYYFFGGGGGGGKGRGIKFLIMYPSLSMSALLGDNFDKERKKLIVIWHFGSFGLLSNE